MTTYKVYSQTCQPCKVAALVMAENKRDYEPIDFDDEDNIDFLEKYNVMGVPTVLVVDHDGKLVNRANGLDQIRNKVEGGEI